MSEAALDSQPALSGASAMGDVVSPVSGEPNTETNADRQEASEPGLPEPLAAQAPAPAGDPSAPPPPGTEPSEKTDLGANIIDLVGKVVDLVPPKITAANSIVGTTQVPM